jgi:hypothetical protein
MAIELAMRVAVVSHDAGGAEVLSSHVRHHNLDCLYVLEGPALKIFERKLGPIKNTSLEDAISQSISIICSTSWQFSRLGVTVLPDEIWVGDTMAEAMIKEIFPITPVVLMENPYLQDIRKELCAYQMNRSSHSDFISILYVCEPVSTHALLRHGDARFWGYVEEEALRYFLSNISVLGKPIECILIRPHPSEPIDKYYWIQHEFKLPIQFGGTRPLLEEIVDSDVVVGCESMAMVVALLANKKVISCIPPGGRSCVLPHSKIAYLQNILENKRSIYENNE